MTRRKRALAGDLFRRLKLTLLVASLLAVVSCASSGPTIVSNADPATDFGALRTFGFMQPLGTDRQGGARTPLSTMLIAAVSRELEVRGLRQSDAGDTQPDVLVNLFANTEQLIDIRQVPATSTWHPRRGGRYSAWRGYDTQVRQFTQGTLVVDLVDPARNVLVWEGVAQGRLRQGATVDQAFIDSLVKE